VSRPRADDDGQASVFVVILATAVVMFAGLLLDGGLALAAQVRALGEAQEAARAGAQALDLNAYRTTGTVRLLPDEARTRARTHLTHTGTGDTGTVTVTDNTVTVTVTAHQHTQLLGFLGLDTLTVTATGTARPAHGTTTPNP